MKRDRCKPALGQADDSAQAEALAAAWLRRASALEMVHACKPDPAVYRFALDRLALDPRRTLMVASHAWDLRAAAGFGLRTAFIQRAGEDEPEPSDAFNLTVPDLAALAGRLLA